MTTPTDSANLEHGALGIYQVLVNNSVCWFHGGFWGLHVLTCPDLDLTIARSWNQAATPDAFNPSAMLLEIADTVTSTSGR